MNLEKKYYCYYVSFVSRDNRLFNKFISLPEKKNKKEIEKLFFEKLVNVKKVIKVEEYSEAIFLESY